MLIAGIDLPRADGADGHTRPRTIPGVERSGNQRSWQAVVSERRDALSEATTHEETRTKDSGGYVPKLGFGIGISAMLQGEEVFTKRKRLTKTKNV